MVNVFWGQLWTPGVDNDIQGEVVVDSCI
jgi:hypothetical protein